MKLKTTARGVSIVAVGFLLLVACENPVDEGGTISDPDLYYTWSTQCVVDGSNSYLISMSFDSDGSFARSEHVWTGDDTCVGIPSATEITSTFVLHGPSASDASMKRLQYLDNSDSPVFASYRVTGSDLEMSEDASAYPADLMDALSLSRP